MDVVRRMDCWGMVIADLLVPGSMNDGEIRD